MNAKLYEDCKEKFDMKRNLFEYDLEKFSEGISDDLILKQKLQNIENELNLLLSENNLKIDFDIFDMENLSKGKYQRVKLKLYKEVI